MSMHLKHNDEISAIDLKRFSNSIHSWSPKQHHFGPDTENFTFSVTLQIENHLYFPWPLKLDYPKLIII